MGIVFELNKEAAAQWPDGKIGLPDGRLIDAYPVATAEADAVTDDTLGIDPAGKCLTPPARYATEAERAADKELFLQNAFYLLGHRERILADSRMFLCPVPIRVGLAYFGDAGFRNPTLGIYLLWWDACPGAVRTDWRGRRSLVYHLAGSPLSGMNKCGAIREDGKRESVTLRPFSDHWQPFVRINRAYAEAKPRYQAYTLRQVLDILDHEEEGDREYAHSVNEYFHASEIKALNRRIAYLNAQNKALEARCDDVMSRWKEEKIVRYYAEYCALKSRTESETALLAQQKRDLRASFRRGEYDRKEYEPQVVAINRKIAEAEAALRRFQYEGVREVFPDDAQVTFWKIEQYALQLKQKQEEARKQQESPKQQDEQDKNHCQ